MAILDHRRGASQAEVYEYRRSKWTDEEKKERDSRLTPAERAYLPYLWEFWGRPNQLLPADKIGEVMWQTWLLMSGRGFGKTRVGAECTREWIKRGFNYCNIIAPTADDARDICVEGESGILAICPKTERPEYVASKRQLQWQNGAISLIFTADEPERLRGKQHMKLWCDELAAWRYLNEAWTQAMLGLRLGANPQAVVTTTPRPLKEVKELIASPVTFLTRGTTYDNKRNLAPAFFQRIITRYEGTRLGRQELDAEVLEDRPGALFIPSIIEETRTKSEDFWTLIFPHLVRVVGGIDPAVTANEETSAETGIVFCGMDNRNPAHFYVFDDRSGVLTPDAWAKSAIVGYRTHRADRLVAEKNQGGDLVEATLRHVDSNVSFRGVSAAKGKLTRAEPIAALYEQRRVHHVGLLSKLEDQMCDYEPGITEESPDRMDALVWAMTELSENQLDLGLLDYFKTGLAASELEQLKDKINEINGTTSVTVLAEQKKKEAEGAQVNCPQCEAALIQKISNTERRCAQCGHQWHIKKPAAPFHATFGNVQELTAMRSLRELRR